MFARFRILPLASALLASAALAVEPATSIGYVMKVQGEATVSIDGTTQSATIGTPLYVGSVVKTGSAGSMGVTLKDNTVMSFGPNSELTIDEFLFDPAQDELKLSAKITHGTLDYISGTIAKLKPKAVEINTPTGTIGVRGTHFLVKVD
ncbi:FecR domain-containing protein [Pseudomonas sp. MM211]|nr:FecR domain-containing protein [Pseudomonas sp. MM211]